MAQENFWTNAAAREAAEIEARRQAEAEATRRQAGVGVTPPGPDGSAPGIGARPGARLMNHFNPEEAARLNHIWQGHGHNDLIHHEKGMRVVVSPGAEIHLDRTAIRFHGSPPDRDTRDNAMQAAVKSAGHLWNGSINVHGDAEFKLRSWAHAQVAGVKVVNFAPPPENLERAQAMVAELNAKFGPGAANPAATAKPVNGFSAGDAASGAVPSPAGESVAARHPAGAQRQLSKAIRRSGERSGEIRRQDAPAASVASAKDPLYDRAVDLVVKQRKASTSFLQRSLEIGYNLAAKLIERMEQEGVVGPVNHVGKREVLITQREPASARENATVTRQPAEGSNERIFEGLTPQHKQAVAAFEAKPRDRQLMALEQMARQLERAVNQLEEGGPNVPFTAKRIDEFRARVNADGMAGFAAVPLRDRLIKMMDIKQTIEQGLQRSPTPEPDMTRTRGGPDRSPGRSMGRSM